MKQTRRKIKRAIDSETVTENGETLDDKQTDGETLDDKTDNGETSNDKQSEAEGRADNAKRSERSDDKDKPKKQKDGIKFGNDTSNFVDMVNNSVSILREIIGNAGTFNRELSTALGLVDTINEQTRTYRKLSLSSIRKDLFDMYEKTTNFEFYKTKLIEALDSEKKPRYDRIDKIEFINYEIEEIDYDKFLEMQSYLDETDRKQLKKYLSIKNTIKQSLKNYPQQIIEYENKMIKQRERAMEILKNNIDKLFGIHAAYAWCLKHQQPTEEFNKLGLNLYRSQREFVKENVKKILKLN